VPFAGGYYYNVHWGRDLDWLNVGIQASEFFTADEPGVVLRFNYTSKRELFDLSRLAAGTIQNFSNVITNQNHQVPDP
jgi:hypothetical protein